MIYTTTYSFKRISFLFFLMVLLSINSIIRAQTPGGVSTGLNLWLDASDAATVSGNNLTGWIDKTATNTFTVSALPPTVTTNAINFHSTVDFNNTTAKDVYPGEQSLMGNTAINFTDAYAVFKVNNGNGGVIIGGTIPGSSYGKAVFAEFNSGINSGTGDPITYSNYPFTDFENYHVFGMDTNIAGNLTGRLDGLDQTVTNSTGFSSINLVPTIGTTNNNGNLAGWNHLNGQIAEVIIYDQSTAGNRINIESYLALKYGIHKAGNYVSSSNTVIWNAIANAGYHNDVFGIGRDDASGLNQNIANSMATGSGDGTGQSGKGNIVISNPSALTNNSFLLVGHDTSDFSFVTSNLPVGSPTGFARMNRIWKTQTTGSVGTTSLQFDITGISVPGIVSDLKLLIDEDGDGNFATGTITTVSSGSVTGNTIVFDNVNFPTGAVFTFAAIPSAPITVGPGGVLNNLKLWLKADLNVSPATEGANITAWGDQSGGGNNAVYVSSMFSTSVKNPTYQLNVLNFNPIVRFAGVNLANFSGIGGSLSPTLTSNNISAYTVFLMNSASSGSGRAFIISQNSSTSDYQNQASSALINRNGSNINSYRNTVAGPTVGPVLGKYSITSTHFTSANQWRSEINGNNFTSQGFSTAPFNSGYYRLGISTYNANDYLNGDIAEVILYDADQSSQPGHNQIESYLALKYGIHKTGSYVNSTGINIWDSTVNSPYHNDVFGIGQDDLSGLNQSVSNSLNTGSGDGTGQSAKGNIVISNASSLVNNGFLVIGHDTGVLTETNVTLAGHLTKRVPRLWKVQSTGNPGTVTLDFDKTGLTYSGVLATDYTLLVDPTGTGDFNTDSVKQYPATAITGNKITFNTVNLPTGAVFSIQTSFTAVNPSLQATNVTFTNTTDTGTTLNWTNGNGALRQVFILEGTTGSPVPVNNTTYVPNTTFGTGTQIGTTGWYSVYKGTGTSVTISGLTPVTNYLVMTVEYNGISGSEAYFSTVSTGNPAALLTPVTGTNTTGPGGVLAGLNLWLDASNGATAASNNLTGWTDKTNINTFTVSATPPTFIANAINFHPTVNFVNTLPTGTFPATQSLIGNTTITYTDAYAVFKVNNSNGGTIIGGTVPGSLYGKAVFSEGGSFMYTGTGVQSVFSRYPFTDYTNFHVFGMNVSISKNVIGRVDANNQTIDNQFGFTGFNFIPTVGTTNNIGNNNGWRHLNGQIAEVIIYNQSIGLQRINIESYLALKYGIHKTDNYVDSANNIIWDATANAAYHNDVFGFGQDDLSGLNQAISNSMNTGTGDGTGQAGKGNIVINNPSSLVMGF